MTGNVTDGDEPEQIDSEQHDPQDSAAANADGSERAWGLGLEWPPIPPGQEAATAQGPALDAVPPTAVDELTDKEQTEASPLSAASELKTEVRAPDIAELFEQQLHSIWRRSQPTDQEWAEGRWQWFRSVVMSGLDPLRILEPDPDDIAAMHVPDDAAALEGSFETVLLVASVELERLAEDTEGTLRFVSGELADALERLEREGEGTLEQRVDLVIRAVRHLMRAVPMAGLVADLSRYLLRERLHGIGHGMTAANLATLALPWDEHLAAVLYHAAMVCFWGAAQEGPVLATPVAEMSRTVNSATHNMASLLARRHQDVTNGESTEVPADQAAAVQRALRDLLVLSAVAAPAYDVVDMGLAEDVLGAVGFGAYVDRAGELIAVLEESGSAPLAWGAGIDEIARLEVASAVAVALVETPRAVGSRLFNAGVSLSRSANRETPAFLSGRFVVNAAGLRWALSMGADLVDALLRHHGLSCSVNLMGALADIKRHHGDLPVELRQLAVWIEALTRWKPLLAAVPDLADLGRIVSSSRRMDLVRATEAVPSSEQLHAAVEAALAFVIPSPGPFTAHPTRQLADAASVVVQQVLAESAGGTLDGVIREIMELRAAPDDVLRERYEPYASGGDPLGDQSPLVNPLADEEAAGLFSRTHWTRLRARISLPIESIAPSLRRLYAAS